MRRPAPAAAVGHGPLPLDPDPVLKAAAPTISPGSSSVICRHYLLESNTCCMFAGITLRWRYCVRTRQLIMPIMLSELVEPEAFCFLNRHYHVDCTFAIACRPCNVRPLCACTRWQCCPYLTVLIHASG